MAEDNDHMTAKTYQRRTFNLLSGLFDVVKLEWSVSKGATDALHYGVTYAPRLDIAVGPFNTGVEDTLGDRQRIERFEGHPLIGKITQRIADCQFNRNPRCVLAVEIEFSGSSKHILGDFANASMMGLIGVVIVPPGKFEKASRIHRYVEFIRMVQKAPADLFRNIALFETTEFLELLN